MNYPDDTIKVITNNVPRDVLSWHDLSDKERKELDYVTAERRHDAVDQFFRYKGQVYDLDEFMTTKTLPEFNPLQAWDGYISDTFFSGVVIRFANEFEQVIVGRFFA